MQTVFRVTFLRRFLLHFACLLFLSLLSNEGILFCRVTAQGTQVTVQSIRQELVDSYKNLDEALQKAKQAQQDAQKSESGDVKRAKAKYEELMRLVQGVDAAGSALAKAKHELTTSEVEHTKAVQASSKAVKDTNDLAKFRTGLIGEFDTRASVHGENLQEFMDLRNAVTRNTKAAADADEPTKQAIEAIGKVKQAADNVEVAVYEVKTSIVAKKITQTQSTVNNYILNVNTLKRVAEKSQSELSKSLTDVSNELRNIVKTQQDTMNEALGTETEERKNIQEMKKKMTESENEVNDYAKTIATESSLEGARQTYEKAEAALKIAESLQQTAFTSFTKIKNSLQTALLENNKAVAIVASAKTTEFAKTAREHATMVAEERKKAETTVASIQSAQNGATDAAAQVVSAQLKIAQEGLNALRQKEAEIEALASEAEAQKTNAESALGAVEQANSYEEAQKQVAGATNAEKIAKEKNEEAKSALDQITPDVEMIERAMHKTTAVSQSSKAAASPTRVNDYVTQTTQKEEEAHQALAFIKDIQTKVPDSGAAQVLAKLRIAETLLTVIHQNVKDVESAKHKAELHRTAAEEILAKLQKMDDNTSDAKVLSDRATEAAVNAEKDEARMKSSFEQLSANLVSLTTTKHEAVSILALAEVDVSEQNISAYVNKIEQKMKGASSSLDNIRNPPNTAPDDVKQHVSAQLQNAEESLRIIRRNHEMTEKLAQEATSERKTAENIFSTAEQTATAENADKQAAKVAQIAAAVKEKEEQIKRAYEEVATEAENVEIAMHRTTSIIAAARTVLSATRAREYATQAQGRQSAAQTNVESMKSAQKDAPSDVRIAVTNNVAQAEESLSIIVENTKTSDHAANEAEAHRRVSESLLAEMQKQDNGVNGAKNLSEKCNVTSTAAAAQETLAHSAFSQIVLESERIEKILQSTTAMIASAAKETKEMLAREVDNGVGDNESYDNISENLLRIYIFEF